MAGDSYQAFGDTLYITEWKFIAVLGTSMTESDLKY